ncbi:DUF485 domain-containing protein [Streptomyces sp. NPDC021056]|uniref:DUF485 domain-containing protein n=1 Tax=Streptomyces sp. NPDC021056 TaxID=3155012 RepID=UPI0033C31D37
MSRHYLPFGAPPPNSETPRESTERSTVAHDPAYRTLRHAQRRFGARATAVAVGGFLAYVLLSSFVPALMNRTLGGHLTVGLALGLGQFVLMGVIVRRYLVHHRTHITPVVRGLRGLARHQEAAGRARVSAAPRERGHRRW